MFECIGIEFNVVFIVFDVDVIKIYVMFGFGLGIILVLVFDV